MMRLPCFLFFSVVTSQLAAQEHHYDTLPAGMKRNSLTLQVGPHLALSNSEMYPVIIPQAPARGYSTYF